MLLVLRWILRPLMSFVVSGSLRRVANVQLKVAGRSSRHGKIEGCEYDFWAPATRVVPGHCIGLPFDGSDAPVLMWIHGGAFILPAMPDGHLVFVKRLCRSLGSSGFVPDYRLAPTNQFPAALNDCENAYRTLLEAGVSPEKIVLGGESAGGNLLMGLLYRIRKHGLPMPSCAVAVSPILDMGRLHGGSSRFAKAGSDAMLPFGALSQAGAWYLGDADSADPEVSPLMGDCTGLPPLLLYASTAELLCDDSVLFARKASLAGVTTSLALWPKLPHAFPLLEDWFAEARPAREDIAAFFKEQLAFSAEREQDAD